MPVDGRCSVTWLKAGLVGYATAGCDLRAVHLRVYPVTLHPDPAILRAIARERDNRLGVYGSTVEPGRVAVGDPVELEP